MKRQIVRIFLILSFFHIGMIPTANAQDYPQRPVHLVIPYAAGGAGDVMGRLVAERLGAKLGQKVIPENRPGAGSVLAANHVSESTPDGYKLYFGTLAHSLNATLVPRLPYDSVKDFEFIGKIGQVVFLVVTKPTLGVDNLPELEKMMRENPGKLSFGSAGIGSPMHIGVELFKQLSRTDALHVPYQGESAALVGLLGGQVDFMLCTTTSCASRLKDGSLKALAVTAPSRSQRAPDVPTTTEAGMPGFQVYTWVFLAAAKNTPSHVIERLNVALNDVLADEDFRRRALAVGFETDANTSPVAIQSLVVSEINKYKPIIEAAGVPQK